MKYFEHSTARLSHSPWQLLSPRVRTITRLMTGAMEPCVPMLWGRQRDRAEVSRVSNGQVASQAQLWTRRQTVDPMWSVSVAASSCVE